MVKQGPCCHCGVASTPLWRNGPSDKPVLCNACGSRWRTKGGLTNYTPLHARAGPDTIVNCKASRIKILTNKDKEENFLKRKRTYENEMSGSIASNDTDILLKVMGDTTSNRSNSWSAVSNYESCVQFGVTFVNEFTGPAQSFMVDRINPAEKRSDIPHPKSSSIAALTKDLCAILHQQQSSSGSYGFSEEDLLIQSDKSLYFSETGHGSCLIRDASSITCEEDSASSFSVNPNCI